IVEALVRPVVPPGGLTPDEEELLSMVAEGKPIKAIAVARHVPPEAADAEVEEVFVKLAEGVSAGSQSALRRLRMLQQAIIDREEQGETLSRLLPGGLAEKLRLEHREIGATERVIVTVLMSDIRSYSTIAEHADPSQLAAQHGSAERLEYALVGDTVNLCQRLQQLADKGETVLSEATVKALKSAVDTVLIGSQYVKGRATPVTAYKIACRDGTPSAAQPG